MHIYIYNPTIIWKINFVNYGIIMLKRGWGREGGAGTRYRCPGHTIPWEIPKKIVQFAGSAAFIGECRIGMT
jgi:hypothetical protein